MHVFYKTFTSSKTNSAQKCDTAKANITNCLICFTQYYQYFKLFVIFVSVYLIL